MHRLPRVLLAFVGAALLVTGCCVSIAHASVTHQWVSSVAGHPGQSGWLKIDAIAAMASNAGLPRLLTEDSSSDFAVRPALIIPTGDGSGRIGKFGKRGRSIHWSAWTTSTASGVGTVIYDYWNGTTWTFQSFLATVHAYRVRDGRFTRLTANYREGGKPQTWAMTLASGDGPGWYWNQTSNAGLVKSTRTSGSG